MAIAAKVFLVAAATAAMSCGAILSPGNLAPAQGIDSPASRPAVVQSAATQPRIGAPATRQAQPSTRPALSQPTAATTIILVRHGERDPGINPPLNQAGLARAQALAETLEDSGITAIYAPDLVRTVQMAQPLADRKGLPIHRIAPVRLLNPPAFARDLVAEILARHPGQVILYVGNDSNLEAIYRHLGGTGTAPVEHQHLCTAVITRAGGIHLASSTFGATK